MNRLTKGKALFYLVSMFAAGIVVGGTLGYSVGKKQVFHPPRRAEMADQIHSRLVSRLNLTEAQSRQIAPLIQNMVGDMEAAHSNSFCQVRDIVQRLHREMAVYLTPEQQQKLAEMEKERQGGRRHFGSHSKQ